MKTQPSREMMEASMVISIRSDLLSAYVSEVIDAVMWDQDSQKVADALGRLREWHYKQVSQAKRSWWQRIKVWCGYD